MPEDEGYRLVAVPDVISARLRTVTDMDGQPSLNFDRYYEAWNDSFEFSFVEPDRVTPTELDTYRLT
jgi:hypothetical protein